MCNAKNGGSVTFKPILANIPIKNCLPFLFQTDENFYRAFLSPLVV